jgi:hypothetical protein
VTPTPPFPSDSESRRTVVLMKKIACILALLVPATAIHAIQNGSPIAITTQPSTQAQEDQPQKHCPGHGHQPGGSAVDINEVNGKPVSLYGKDPGVTKLVNALQATANKSGPGEPGVAAENYGPAGLWRKGKLVRDAKLQDRFHDHVHILPSAARESK